MKLPHHPKTSKCSFCGLASHLRRLLGNENTRVACSVTAGAEVKSPRLDWHSSSRIFCARWHSTRKGIHSQLMWRCEVWLSDVSTCAKKIMYLTSKRFSHDFEIVATGTTSATTMVQPTTFQQLSNNFSTTIQQLSNNFSTTFQQLLIEHSRAIVLHNILV